MNGWDGFSFFSMAASPAWAAKNITVQQLKDLLTADQQAKKADADVANELKRSGTHRGTDHNGHEQPEFVLPGQATLEQIYVLEAKSAILAPPALTFHHGGARCGWAKGHPRQGHGLCLQDLRGFATVTATKTTIRFQDNVSAMAASSGNALGATGDSSTDPNLPADQFIHYINTSQTPVTSIAELRTIRW